MQCMVQLAIPLLLQLLCTQGSAVLAAGTPGNSGYSATTSNMTQPTPHMSIL
jgi:hypothetical protein